MKTLPVAVLIVSLSSVYSAKILLIPGFATSHCLEMLSVGEELLKRGHHVTLYPLLYDPSHCISRVNATSFKPRFKNLAPKLHPSHQKVHDDVIDLSLQYFYQQKNLIFFFWKTGQSMLLNFMDAAFYDKEVLEEMQKDKYDLALVEGLPFTGSMFAVPTMLGIPYGALGSFIDPQDSRMPLQSNIFPSLFTEYSNEMTFIQRFFNTLLFLFNPVVRYIITPSIDLSKYSDKLIGYDSRDLVKHSVLFIENSDYVVDYPKALFPNFVQAGGLTAGPARPLSGILKNYMDQSKEGVVLVTFGSVLKGFPDALKEKLMKALRRLEHPVLYKQDTDATFGNVKVLKWLPQNDILAHPNTKLFISHCGKNGFFEGVFHGVPVICMAIHAETYTTKVKVKKFGIGSSINIFDDSVDDLVATINGVLRNETIYKNMKRTSTIFRDRPETPKQRAASAVEHVLKYGGDHMKPPSVQFSFITYIMADVWCTIFLTTILIFAFDIWIFRKCCCRRTVKYTKQKTE